MRIGNTDEGGNGLVPLTANDFCGSIGLDANSYHAFVTCGSPMTGQFITIQRMIPGYLEIDNVYICEVEILAIFMGLNNFSSSIDRSQLCPSYPTIVNQGYSQLDPNVNENRFYRIAGGGLQPTQTDVVCSQDGATFASLESPEQMAEMKSFVQAKGGGEEYSLKEQ